MNSNNYQSFLIKYSEIGLKGKNRYVFEDALVKNIKNALRDNSKNFDIYKEEERIYVDSKNDFNYDETIDVLKKVFGIYNICPLLKFDYSDNLNDLVNKLLEHIKSVYGNDPNFTFKIRTRRKNKNFPMTSDEINAELGGIVLDNFKNLKVDVHNPDIYFYIEIRKHINIYSEQIKGARGMPVGTSGKAMVLLSGGIDSPVATYLTAKRGVEVNCVYFNAPPYTSDRAKQKVIDLAKIVAKYSGPIKLNIINFTDIQLLIYDKCPHDELTIIMRRYMMKIAEMLAIKQNCHVLVTGESIGQVASQTLLSLHCTNDVCNLPVLRPVITYDKDEIIELAQKIGTYDTSILPYEDCCTIFVAKHPVTKPKLPKILQSEENLKDEIDELIVKAINTNESIICK